MGALFPPWTNSVSRSTLVLLVLGLGALIWWAFMWVRSPWYSNQHNPVEQPVQFDHRHHVGDDGIDCRFCHTTVETSPSAGYPATQVCMSCHAQIWNKSSLLGIVRSSYFTGRPIIWNRVNRVPDFTYFNHAIHVNKGVGCVTCHGRVDQMPQMVKFAPLNMGWCIDCHRNPTPHLRPREFITSMDWTPS